MDIPKPKAPPKKSLSPESDKLVSEIRGLTASIVIVDEVKDVPTDILNSIGRRPPTETFMLNTRDKEGNVRTFEDIEGKVTITTTAPKKPRPPLKPHLTQSPFRNSELADLKKKLEQEQPPVKRKPTRRTPARNKLQEKKR